MFMKSFLSTNICLTLVTFQKIQSFFDKVNKKVIGKIKDVSEGKIIDEFVGLKSKRHSMTNIDGKETNTAKGVSVVTEFKKFKNILLNKKIMRHKMRRIQAKNHKLETYEINKISLLCFGEKRFVLKDGIYTRAYFHKDLYYKYYFDRWVEG